MVNISVINQIEVLGFNGQQQEMQILEEFTVILNVIPLSENIVEETIKLRKQYKVKLPDAIIAATALQHNLTIITQNIKDFRNIPNISIINAHDK